MALFPIHRCAGCNASSVSSKLFSCSASEVVYYCGRDHQASDRDAHKWACNAIKKSQKRLDQEETTLRSQPGDGLTPPNLFEEHAGHFWGIAVTLDYMKARYALVGVLLKFKTYAAVEAAYGHTMEMLRLCRGENMGVHDLVPALALRLGRD
jgi:hypothetical protein